MRQIIDAYAYQEAKAFSFAKKAEVEFAIDIRRAKRIIRMDGYPPSPASV